MGLFTNDKQEIQKMVEEQFGEGKNYVLALKHNNAAESGLKLLISSLYNTLDSNRTFILVFDSKGICEKEISTSDKSKFYLMPESEVEELTFDEKDKKGYINFRHITKNLSYEIPFTGRLFEGNKERFEQLQKEWAEL
nr:hypothetical protein [uncultured Peptoniphilus sp.]